VRMNPKVVVVVLNWNSWPDTLRCLDSLVQIDYPNYEVTIVDNGSTDVSVEKIRDWFSRNGIGYDSLDCSASSMDIRRQSALSNHSSRHSFALAETGKNLGYTGGNNAGISYGLQCGAQYVLVLNEDTKVSRNFLSKMVETAEKDPTVGLVGCKVCALEDPSRVLYQGGNLNFRLGARGSFRNHQKQYHGQIDVNFVPGCAMLIRRAVLETAGLFEESYFLYMEDVEFSFRLRKAGWRLTVNRDALIWHRAVPERGKRSLGYYYYGTRNILYFISKHLRGPQRASCLLFFSGGRLLQVFYWLFPGKYDHAKATLSGALDYFRGVTGSKQSGLARCDERVPVAS